MPPQRKPATSLNLPKGHKCLLPFLLFLITIATRIPFTEKLLYHMDSVQYALAIGHYDITVHQPHPPGYFLYVMLGRAAYAITGDPHTALLSLSILFSALTVVAIYYLARELHDDTCALMAALLAITSPNLWFHGEVALNYVIEAFFSTVIALLCWHIHRGKVRLVWLSAIILAMTGGVRQSTAVFLFPLWLLAIRRLPLRTIITAVGLFVIASLCWFVPMVWMTGGLERYLGAFRELWLFTGGQASVFQGGWPTFKYYASTVFIFTVYGIGGGIGILILRLYHGIRTRGLMELPREKVLFYLAWLLPPILFHLLIFIQPANPGYALIYLPPLLILVAASICHTSTGTARFMAGNLSRPLFALLICINLAIFFFAHSPVSYPALRKHDKDLAVILSGFSSFDSSSTALFIDTFIFYGPRHLMYYLPDYATYMMDIRVAPTGELRQIFYGINGKTYISRQINLPAGIKQFATLKFTKPGSGGFPFIGLKVVHLAPEFSIVAGPIAQVERVYPDIKLVMPKIGG
ncbi:MAG: glycosyltransferase family 39 protein [Geobacteraceae bacterium]